MSALAKRLMSWNEHWDDLCSALQRDCNIPAHYKVQPWAFIPSQYVEVLKNRLSETFESAIQASMPYPQITHLESVVPWNYVTWDRKVTDLEDET